MIYKGIDPNIDYSYYVPFGELSPEEGQREHRMIAAAILYAATNEHAANLTSDMRETIARMRAALSNHRTIVEFASPSISMNWVTRPYIAGDYTFTKHDYYWLLDNYEPWMSMVEPITRDTLRFEVTSPWRFSWTARVILDNLAHGLAWVREAPVVDESKVAIRTVSATPIVTETGVNVHHNGVDKINGIAADILLHGISQEWEPHVMRDSNDRDITHTLHSATAATTFIKEVSKLNRVAHNAKQEAMKDYKAAVKALTDLEPDLVHSAEGQRLFSAVENFDIYAAMQKHISSPPTLLPVAYSELVTWGTERIDDAITYLLKENGGTFAPPHAFRVINSLFVAERSALSVKTGTLRNAVQDLEEDDPVAVAARMAYIGYVKTRTEVIRKTDIPEPVPEPADDSA